MTRIATILLTALLLVSRTYGAEPDSSKIAFQLGVGPAAAVARLGNVADYGFHAVAGFEIRPTATLPEMSLVATAGYARLLGQTSEDPDVSILSGALDIKIAPSWRNEQRFFLSVGAGIGQVRLENPPDGHYLVGTATSESKPLFEVAIGIERRPVKGIGYLVELKGVNIFSSRFGDYRFGTLTFGVCF